MFPALVPRALPTRTLAVPAVSDGVTAVICVPDTTTIEVALVTSKVGSPIFWRDARDGGSRIREEIAGFINCRGAKGVGNRHVNVTGV